MAGLFRRITEKLFTSKSVPKQASTQARHVLDKQFGGSTKDMAARYGVTPRTVQRWLDGTRAPKGATKKDIEKATREGKPTPQAMKDRLESDAAAVQVTEKGRERAAKQFEGAADSGVAVTVARMDTFAIKGSPAARSRPVTLYLSGDQAAQLARSTNDAEAQEAIGGALATYFNGGAYGGFRAGDFTFDPGDVSL
jgi:DNA-binding transcriptional regulator YiaG